MGVRVAGSPVQDLQALRFVATWNVVEEHVQLARWLSTEGQALSDLLYPVIGACPEGGVKPLLVALRRAVFAGKAPGDRAWSEAVRGVLPVDLAARIAEWATRLDRLKTLEAGLAEVLATEKSVLTDALRHAVGRSAFRCALVLGSPSLSDALSAWIDAPAARPPRGPVLLRAAKYLSRAVAKTSPYASFTLSGLGSWAALHPSLGPVMGTPSCPTSDLTWRGVAELDRRVVCEVWSALATRPEFRERIQVRVNPSALEVDGQLRFLGAAVGEPVVGVPATEALRRVVDFLRTTAHPTVGELRAQLQSAVAGAEPAQCAEYLERLIDLGLVELRRPFLDQACDPLGDLAQWAAAATDAGEWSETLREARAAVRGYSEEADARARARRLRHIRGIVTDLAGKVAPTVGAAVPDKDLIRENAVITHPVVRCGWEQWRPVLDDLDTLRGFLGIFNPHLPAQAEAAGFFRDRFAPGAVVPFLGFYREFHAARSHAARSSGVAFSGLPPTDELAGLRRAAGQALYHGTQDASNTIQADPATLATLVASWPPSIRAPGSICCYAQPLPGPDGPRLVLNLVRTGYGWGISRIHHLITQAGETARSGEPAPVPWRPGPIPRPSLGTGDPGVLLVECRAAFGTNLSLRPAAVPYALDYPCAEDDTDAAARVSMLELQVSDDPGRDALVLRERRRGAEVRPLALGMLVEHALPPALRFLIRVFGEPQTALAPHLQLADAGWRAGADGLGWRPRLQLGRIVLLRAAWSLPAHQLPRRAKGESDATYLLRFARWRDHYGIPRQCFVRTITPPGRAGAPRSPIKAYKPRYLDVTNWFLLTAFERSSARLDDPDAVVVFEEALPVLADAPRYGEHGQRVTEYIVQLSARTADD